MLKLLRARIQQKHRTMGYPDASPPEMPDRFAGRPVPGCPPHPLTILDGLLRFLGYPVTG
ncbi:MAG: hypothetical protein P1S46_07300 [bacterium]|nr:hypothetical protein [bacterium]MDT8395647.1 hypothetical protein [bacterium]